MSREEYSPLSPELTAYMIRAIQANVTELRKELHEDYLNKSQLENYLVKTKRVQTSDYITRVFAAIAASGTIADIIARLTGH